MTQPPEVAVPTLLLTVEQAAAACQVSRGKFDQWTRRRGFPVIRDGQVVRVPLELLKSWLEAWAQPEESYASMMVSPIEPLRRRR